MGNSIVKKGKLFVSAYIKRVIAHPNFHNIGYKECEKILSNMDQGECIIRPSSKVSNMDQAECIIRPSSKVSNMDQAECTIRPSSKVSNMDQAECIIRPSRAISWKLQKGLKLNLYRC